MVYRPSFGDANCVVAESHGGNYPAGGGFFDRDDDDDFRTAKEEASHRAGSSGSGDLFSSIISSIGQKKSSLASEGIDEEGECCDRPTGQS